MEQDETNKRTHLYTYEELAGKSITMSAYHYQSLWQALRLIENRLPVEDGCVDYGSDLELGEVHNCLIAAAVCTGERLSNRNLAEAIQQRVMMPKAGNQDAYDQGNTLHKQSMASEKNHPKQKPHRQTTILPNKYKSSQET